MIRLAPVGIQRCVGSIVPADGAAYSVHHSRILLGDEHAFPRKASVDLVPVVLPAGALSVVVLHGVGSSIPLDCVLVRLYWAAAGSGWPEAGALRGFDCAAETIHVQG